MRVAIVGAGAVGTALGLGLKLRNHELVGAVVRSVDSGIRTAKQLGCLVVTQPARITRDADLIFLTTPDRFLDQVVEQLAGQEAVREGQLIVHTSGAISSQILKPLKKSGAWIASVHPLQTFPNGKQGVHNLRGTVFSIEGDEEIIPSLEQVVKDLGGKSFRMTAENKSMYHAAAVIVSNYLVVLSSLSQKLLTQSGMPASLGIDPLLPLINGTLQNLQQLGISGALTGPIARGDVSTVKGHLEILERCDPQILDIYKMLGTIAVNIVREKGTVCSVSIAELEYLLNTCREGRYYPQAADGKIRR